MTTQTSPFRRTNIRVGRFVQRRSRRARNQSGVALLTTLLLLVLVSILGLAMAVTTNSDMLINSYYGNYRGSFYAADSGLNIARADMLNQLAGQVNMTACTGWQTGGGCGWAPLNGATAASTARSYLTSHYGSFGSLNAGQGVNSWPGSFMVPASVTGCSTDVQLVSGGPTHVNSLGQNDIYTYTFSYELCSVGRAQALQQVATKEKGNATITIKAHVPTGQVPTTFAAFGAFINQFNPCQGPLVYGTMSGPFFTNGSWNFGSNGSYIFTDPVSQHNTQASFYVGSTCHNSASDSYTSGHTTVAPTFQGGFNRSADAVPLPDNDFTQQWAIIDGLGCGEHGTTCGVSAPPNPTDAELAAALKDISGNAAGSSNNGVYLPFCTGGAGCTTPNTVTGGGIFVEGDASIQLSTGTDGSGNLTQIYQITQTSSGGGGHRWGHSGGSGGTSVVTTITTNLAANTTTIARSGVTTRVLTGVPMNNTGGTPQPGTMLYVDGTITGLKGPGQGQPAIQDHSQITVSGAGDINITGDLIYKHEPVTLDGSATYIPGNDFDQVLGVFTNHGNINLDSPYSNNNLQTDASLAAINSTCPGGSSSCGFHTNSSINTWTIVGGRIENYAHSVSISHGNTYFDRRFTLRQGFAPPWFPSTLVDASVLPGAASAPDVIPDTQRTTWVTWPQ